MTWLVLIGCVAATVLLMGPPIVRAVSRPGRDLLPAESPTGLVIATLEVPVPVSPLRVAAEADGRLARVRVVAPDECVFGFRHTWVPGDVGLLPGTRLHGRIRLDGGVAHAVVSTSRLGIAVMLGASLWFLGIALLMLVRERNAWAVAVLFVVGWFVARRVRVFLGTAPRALAQDAVGVLERLECRPGGS